MIFSGSVKTPGFLRLAKWTFIVTWFMIERPRDTKEKVQIKGVIGVDLPQNLGKIEKELKRQEGWWEESKKFNRLERSMRLKRKIAREAES